MDENPKRFNQNGWWAKSHRTVWQCRLHELPDSGQRSRTEETGWESIKGGGVGGPSGVVFYLKLAMTQHYDTVNHLYYSKSRAGMLSYRALGQHCVQTQVAWLTQEGGGGCFILFFKPRGQNPNVRTLSNLKKKWGCSLCTGLKIQDTPSHEKARWRTFCRACHHLYKKKEGDVCMCICTQIFVCMYIKEIL